jgi:hypothetical protein
MLSKTNAETTYRASRFATAFALALLLGCSPQPPVPDTLPAGLTNEEFWKMITTFSEPGGYFQSDNFLSNESGYQSVIPGLLRTLSPGGVYIGVGPEQNFTYIIALQPKIAFIIDIRRQNMLEHLFYKALMETSADRADFLSRLFARPEGRPSSAFFEANLRHAVEYLKHQKGFMLSDADEVGIRHVAEAFFKSGPDLRYTLIGRAADSKRMPTYSDLMAETDGALHNWNFVATEAQFQAIQRMQQNNLIVPLVGDFAGPKTIRSIAHYVEEHRSTVRSFYTSNVEQYLFEDGEHWKHFYDNVLLLPTDSTSTFIRYIPETWRFDRYHTSLTSRINSTMSIYRSGFIRSYNDIVSLSR